MISAAWDGSPGPKFLAAPWAWLGAVVGFLGQAFFLTAQLWYIPFEERALTRRFGAEYLAYRAKVRRWI